MTRDNMQHHPSVRSAKSARCPELCGPKDVGPLSKCQFRASSHGGAQRHLVSAPRRIAAIQNASWASWWGATAPARTKCAAVRRRSRWPSCDASLCTSRATAVVTAVWTSNLHDDRWPAAHAARARHVRTILLFPAHGMLRRACARARRARAYSYKFMKPHGYRFPTVMGSPNTKPPPYDFLNLYGACLQAPRTPKMK
jgi:hypothetical protein